MVKIKSIKRLKIKEPMYDIGIKDNHNFFADNILVHNCHRWSRSQQDALLPSVERGTIVLIGATTQNPYFSINGPLISRSELFEFKHLIVSDLSHVVAAAVRYYQDMSIVINWQKGVREVLLERVGGDARKLLNVMEIIVETEGEDVFITKEMILEILPRKHVVFDQAGDEHFDCLSALQGSIQASDPHSAVYWLAWAINRGEDLKVICRRMLVTAAEDVGLCDPQCLPYVYSAVAAAQQVGLPEASIILSSAVIYMASSPRSKASAKAIWKALEIDKNKSRNVPDSLKDSHYAGAGKLMRGSFKDGMNPGVYEPIITDLFQPENGRELELIEYNKSHWQTISNRRRTDAEIEE